MKINEIIELLELESVENGYQENIDLWKQFYNGQVAGFHDYEEFIGTETVKRERLSLQMAKTVCEKWADTSYNPETDITVEDSFQDRLKDILDMNDFENKINREIEKGYAFGTMGIITSPIDEDVDIQFVTADMMIPVYSDDRFAWAIISQYNQNTYYVSVHYDKSKLGHQVDNHIIKVDNDKLTLLSNETVEQEYGIKSMEFYQEPMLHIFKPAIANNIDYNSPYGISIFGNALSELKAVDMSYSNMNTELEIGKMRLFSTVQNLEMEKMKPTFNFKQEGFYVIEGDQTFSDGTTIKTHSPTLRSADMINTLETNLNMLGRKIGFGDDAFTFSKGTVYTNTAQVISTNSEFYKTRQKMLVALESTLVGMVRAIYLLDTGRLMDQDVSVDFDDSIIHDKEQEEKDLTFQLMNGLISEQYYWQVKHNLSEELAKEFYERMQKEKGLIEMPDEEGGEE